MLVRDMIEELKKMPQGARLKIEVDAYYYEGGEFDDVIKPEPNRPKNTVTIGSVYAQP